MTSASGHTHNYRHIERGNQTESAAGYASLFPAFVRCSSTGVVFLLTRGMTSASGYVDDEELARSDAEFEE
ncbi:hypothetical protein Taro_016991 [Colocasia esculenta]|uniref:Uncharacterized protein n=1 Tax=Colocasia esculenta TaxID=4460 RepID=A0A843UQ05_COLES|nr:hypothetical protein [Colocasia esculenta]